MTDYIYDISQGNAEYSPFDLFNNHTLTMTGSYLESNFSFSRQGNDLIIYNGFGSTITINGHFNLFGFSQIDTVFIQNGSTFNLTDPNTKILDNDDNTAFGDVGNNDDEIILGGVNNNNISGYGGNDTLYLGDGDDIGNGGNGNDTIYGSYGNDTINGGSGNDMIDAGSGTNVIDGGSGIDIINYQNATSRVNVNLALGKSFFNGYGSQDTFSNIEHVITTDFNDIVVGNNGDNIIETGGANDVIFLSETTSGNNTIDAGDGNDSIKLSTASNNFIDGGAGIDNINFTALNNEFVLIDIEAGSALVNNQNNFVSNFTNVESANGTSNNDFIFGSSGKNVLRGESGDDLINGRNGNDRLDGDLGNDILYGGNGNDSLDGDFGDDTLYGGDGLDTLLGGDGADLFVFENISAFNNVDRVQDFDVSENDILDLSDILNAYDPISDSISNFVKITSDTSHSYLEVDSDGGANNYVRIAQFTNDTSIEDAATLEANGNIIL